MEAEELKFLLDHVQSQLVQAKTNKQRLVLMRDRVLVGIMSLEGCRTVEMHSLKIENVVRQGIKTGLQVSAKRASRVVPLTDNLTTQLDEYLQMRQKVLRRKIKLTDFVFVSLSNNSKGGQLSRRSIRAIIDSYLVATKSQTPKRSNSFCSQPQTYCWNIITENWFGFKASTGFIGSCRSQNYFYLRSCRRSLGKKPRS